MTYQLTKEEKQSVINQHLKNLVLNKYSIELSKKEAEAVLTEEQMSGTSFDSQIAEIDSKIAALNTELAALEE
jgi:hypothetical protein